MTLQTASLARALSCAVESGHVWRTRLSVSKSGLQENKRRAGFAACQTPGVQAAIKQARSTSPIEGTHSITPTLFHYRGQVWAAEERVGGFYVAIALHPRGGFRASAGHYSKGGALAREALAPGASGSRIGAVRRKPSPYLWRGVAGCSLRMVYRGSGRVGGRCAPQRIAGTLSGRAGGTNHGRAENGCHALARRRTE